MRDREVPTKYEHVIKWEWHRAFTLRERLKILIGYNLVALNAAAVRHNPGQPFHPKTFAALSKQLTPDDHMRQVVTDQMQALLTKEKTT